MNPEHEIMVEAYVKYLNYWAVHNGEEAIFSTDMFDHVVELARHQSEWWETVIVLEAGYGDDAGPALLVGHVHGSGTPYYLESLTQTFDTITSPIIMDGKEVYAGGR